MTPQDKVESLWLKGLLFVLAAIFAVAAALLAIFLTSAATVTGKTPDVAVSLVHGVNTGVLGPGEQRWFKFKPDGPVQTGHVPQSFTLVFTPADGQRTTNVTFQLFAASQLPYFFSGDAGKMANFGAGQIIAGDGDPQTGKLFWTGWLYAQDTYYLQIMNANDVAIDYWLLPGDASSYALAGVEGPDSKTTPTPTPVFAAGATPQTAIPLMFGVNHGGLNPGQEIWYSFRVTDLDQEYFEEMALTMVTTPDNRQRIQSMTFELFTAAEARLWSPGNGARLNNVGAGSIVFRDDNPQTGERFWSGWVVDNDLYYVQIRNGADVYMDYWLFTGDVYRPELK